MIERKFGDSEGSESVGFSHGDFCFVVQTLDYAAGELFSRAKIVEDEFAVGIPMMSISHSDLMPIRSERSDAGLSQCEIVIGISQAFCSFLCLDAGEFPAFPGVCGFGR